MCAVVMEGEEWSEWSWGYAVAPGVVQF